MKKELIIKFTYDGILLLNKNLISNYSLISSVENYKIINRQKFISSLNKIIDKLKINKHLFSENISIIIDSTYNKEDIEIITECLKELSFNKINYLNILNILKPYQKELIIELSNVSFKIYYLNNIYISNIYFQKPLQFITPFLNELIKSNNINYIKIYGSSNSIPTLLNYLERKYHIKAYYYSKPELYPMQLFVE